ncbi:zinc finger protein 135-like [Elgaria multicarinata webbii]|uniref:zinc finger protein 135-like n=1 Tax=Elgaria multicarinata webbii TaxID=159646 RepID=UPI002FCD1DA4
MKEKKSEELEERPERAGKTISAVQLEYMTRQPGWGVSQVGKGEPSKEMQQRWEAQWQEFLKTLQSPYLAWGNLQLSETTPWDDAKAFLASFEQVAEACHWPRGEWAARLLPALSGEAEQAFRSLEARDQEDYGKVKAAILRGEALRMEAQRQHFRQFCCQEVEDPRRIHIQLQELCRQWLKPERHSKEQILELLILEQFLASLPVDLQGWIRAGGPDTCSQAVALAEDFLMSQREAEGGKWQRPLQDVCVGSIDAEEVPSDIVPGQIYKEAKQLGEEISLLDSGIKCPSHSSSSLTPEGRDMTRAGPSEGLLNLKETGVSLHVVERTLTQPGQQTMFWQVLPEEDGNMQSFGDGKGQLKVENSQCGRNEPEDTSRTLPQISQGNVSVTAEIHEERCDEKRYWINMAKSQQGDTEPEEIHRVVVETIQWNFPVTSETHELRCDEKRCWIKMEKSQQGDTEPEETHRVVAETIQWNFPVTSEMHELRCESKGQQEKTTVERGREFTEPVEGRTGDEKRSLIKTENSQEGEMGPEEMHSTLPEISEGNILVKAEIHGQRCESKGEQGKKPVEREDECSEVAEGLTGTISQISRVSQREEMPLFSTYDMKYSHRSELTMIHTGEDHYECPILLKNFQQKSRLDKHQGFEMGEKENEASEYKKRDNLTAYQSNHAGKEMYDYPECEKSFNYTPTLKKNQGIHFEGRPYQCSSCGKSFTLMETLKRHQRIHTGVKPYRCPQCGKCFSQRNHLKKHERIHSGVKPHKCSQCGKCFINRDHLKNHQRIHTGEKPYECPDCGKSFSRREHLKKHQRIHTGEKPYECSQCGKCFRQREHLIGHQRTHITEHPLKCQECGRDFSRRDMLIRHQGTHRGQKSYKCPECGKSFSQEYRLIKHQSIHEQH